ncbi:hypothetical protein TrST_g8473 [Triparma strigata]|uniref:Uncharacterized protein n=1 Tax=Triparma strigata TaxID=1606541 RepID=A0A9W7C0Z3_9STRA|nr:hypothetical protein TrST_g8473 [Triparma strigata]
MSPPPPPSGPPPPPLDVYKNLSLIRSSLDYVLTSTPSGLLKRYDLSSASTASIPPKKRLDIPVPVITKVQTYFSDLKADFEIPPSLVRLKVTTRSSEAKVVSYSLDSSDASWLRNHGVYGVNGSETKRIAQLKSKMSANYINALTDSLDPPSKIGGLGRWNENDMPFWRGRDGEVNYVFTVTENVLEKGLDMCEKLTGTGPSITLPLFLPPFLAYYSTFPFSPPPTHCLKTAASAIHTYWMQKRLKQKLPLMRRFWPSTSATDTNPHAVFRPREKEKYKLRRMRKNDLESYKKLILLRMDFERLRHLATEVLRREKLSMHLEEVRRDIFRLRVHDMTDTSEEGMKVGFSISTVEKALLQTPFKPSLGGGDPTFVSHSTLTSTSSLPKRRKLDRDESIQIEETRQPVPLFTEYLPSRRPYVSFPSSSPPGKWFNVTSYVNPSSLKSLITFKHRGRIGRGGRVLIDRIIVPNVTPSIESDVRIVIKPEGGGRGGEGYLNELGGKGWKNNMVKENVREIGNAWEDEEEEEIVGCKEWEGEDLEYWGRERFAWGPI